MGKAEGGVQKAIKEYLEWQGYTVYRINNSGTFRGTDKQGKSKFSFAGTAGVCDLIALKKGSPALFIECKSEKGKLSEAQKEFLRLVNESEKNVGICLNSLNACIVFLGHYKKYI